MAPHLARAGRGFVLGDFPWEDGLPLVSALRPVVVVEAAGEGEGRTREVSIPAESWRSLRRPLVDELLARGDADAALPGESKRR